jgi:hypothetical protein
VTPQKGTEKVSRKKAQESQKQFSEIRYYFVLFVPFCG